MYRLNGWNKHVFDCIQKLKKEEFDLKELYVFRSDLKKIYPGNNYIEQKIQQVVAQFFEKEGFLKRIDHGRYRLTSKFTFE